MRVGHRIEKRRGRAVALALLTVLAPSANAQTAASGGTAAAGVTAEVVTPAEISVAIASERLLSDSPGVFTLRIPGAASTGAIELTVKTMESSNGTVALFTSSDGAAALRQLIGQIETSAQPMSLGSYQASGTVTNGTIGSRGVQLIVMRTGQNGDGSGDVVAIISFD